MPFIGIKLIDLLLVAIGLRLRWRAPMFRTFRQSLLMLVALTVLTGVVYPLVVTGIAQAGLPAAGQRQPDRARRQGGRLALIGQPFDDPKYFWSRPSATAPVPYNAGASTGSNLGPINPALADAVEGAHRSACAPRTPATARRCRSTWSPPRRAGSIRTSAPAAAEYQVGARRQGARPRARSVSARSSPSTRKAGSSAFSASRGVNVLQLNLALDEMG